MTDILSQTDPGMDLVVQQVEPSPSVPPPSPPLYANVVTPSNTSDGHNCDPSAGECSDEQQSEQIEILLAGAVCAVSISATFHAS